MAAEISRGARTIGDILLQLGFVDSDALAAAFDRQQVTGQPIGQILVEAGSITRLELATALAEQWADPSSPGPRWLDDPRGVGAAAGAVAPADSLSGAEPSGLSPRVAALEAAVSELRDAGDGVYLSQLQDAVVELARRSAGSETAAAELAEKVEESVAALGRLRALEDAVAEATQRLDGVTAGVEVAVQGLQVNVAAVSGTVEQVAGRVDELAARAADAAALEQLRASLEDLAQRPAGDPALAERLAEVVGRIDALADPTPLEELRAAVADLAARPSTDPGLADALDELRAAVAEQAERPAVSPELDGRVDELSARVHELHERVGTHDELRERLAGLAERVEGLAAEVSVRDGDAAAIEALSVAVSEVTGRVEALAAVAGAAVDAEAVEALKVALDELSGRTAADPATAARIDALVEHVALLPDERELQELRDAVAELTARPVADPRLGERLDELSSRLDGAASTDVLERLTSETRELGVRLDEIAARPVVDAVPRPELEGERLELVERLDRLEQVTADLAGSIPSVDPEALGELAGRLDRVEADDPAIRIEAIAEALEHVRAELGERMSVVTATLTELHGRVEGLAERSASEPDQVAGAVADERLDALEARIEEVARERAEPGAAAGERQVGGSTLTGDAQQDIERLRMSIERLGHTLGSQGRAVAELMKARAGGEGLERLTARIEALEDGGVPAAAGEGGAPAGPGLGALTRRVDDTDAALEKLLTQLERMGSSLEWRFQRLEKMVGGGE